MNTSLSFLESTPFIAFEGDARVAAGALLDVAIACRDAAARPGSGPLLMFDNQAGRVFDIDTRGSDEELAARVAQRLRPPEPQAPDASLVEARGRGRPRLGVVAREVTLLPRHWDWLASQPGGASVALRKLVEGASRTLSDHDARRVARERAYHFMSAMAGHRPYFEEAARALFADDLPRLLTLTEGWPPAVREHLLMLLPPRP